MLPTAAAAAVAAGGLPTAAGGGPPPLSPVWLRGRLPWAGPVGAASQAWQGCSRPGARGLYIHTHSVLHLSHVRLGALSRSWAVPTVTGPGGTGRRVKRRYGRSTFDRPGGQPLSLRGQPAEQSSRRPSPQGAGGRVAPTRESGECGAHRFGRPGGDALPGSGLVPPSWAGPLMPSPQGAGCRAVLPRGSGECGAHRFGRPGRSFTGTGQDLYHPAGQCPLRPTQVA